MRVLAGILALDRALAFPNDVAGQRVDLQQANLRAAPRLAQRRAGVQVYAAVFFRFQRRRAHHALAQINGPDRLHRVHVHALEDARVVAIVRIIAVAGHAAGDPLLEISDAAWYSRMRSSPG